MPDFAHLRHGPENTEPPSRRTDVAGPRSRSYWTTPGVIPRWQLFVVYLVIAVVGVVGFVRIGNQADRAEELAKENRALTLQVRHLAVTTRNDRAASIAAGCERNSASVDALIVGSNADQLSGRMSPADARRRRDVTLGLLAALRPVDCPRDPRLPEVLPRKPGPTPTPIPTPQP
jgi:hypothetical protein